MNLESYEFSIKYEGEAIKDGIIPVEYVAPSLLALSDSFQEVKKIIYPESEPVSLEIKSTESGSFDVNLILATGKAIFSTAVNLLSSPQTTAVLNLAQLARWVYKTIKFLIKYRNKKIIKKIDLPNKKQKITFDDGTSTKADKNIVNLYESYEVRTSILKILKPLEKGFVSSIKIVSRKKTKMGEITVSKDDYKKIKFTKTKGKVKGKKVKETTKKIDLYIKSISFDNNKWKFSDGNTEFFAIIKDKDFIDDVSENQKQFGSADTLRVELKKITFQTADGLKNEYIIEKVLKQNKGPQPIELDLDD